MEPENQIGKRIRTARESKGLTQKELAKKVGVTGAYISRLERNDALPSDGLCKKLAKVLDLDERELRRISLKERTSIDVKELSPLEKPTSSELDKDKKEVGGGMFKKLSEWLKRAMKEIYTSTRDKIP